MLKCDIQIFNYKSDDSKIFKNYLVIENFYYLIIITIIIFITVIIIIKYIIRN